MKVSQTLIGITSEVAKLLGPDSTATATASGLKPDPEIAEVVREGIATDIMNKMDSAAGVTPLAEPVAATPASPTPAPTTGQ